tara:strand:+ start:323 stop:1060 length:738 start_codon:yes stop_codon:yes gene_type:complete
MPEEVCADVARELLKHLVCVTGHEQDILAVVRAFKTFRAVNKTFHDAFEADKMGCRILANYTVWLHNGTRKRAEGINRFLRVVMCSRNHMMSRERSRSEPFDWVLRLRASLCVDVQNYRRFIDTLTYVLDGNVLRDWDVMHRAMLPPHHPESLSRDHNGLPRGNWKLSPSHEQVVAPFGSTAWAENHLIEANRDAPGRGAEYVKRVVKALFKITQEKADRSKNKEIDEVQTCLDNLNLSNVSTIL